jgi:hypothetical protein
MIAMIPRAITQVWQSQHGSGGVELPPADIVVAR